MAPVMDFEDTQGNDACQLFDVYNKRDILSFFSGGTNVCRLTKDGFIFSTSGWIKRFVNVNIGDVAADSDAYTYPLFRSNVKTTIKNIELAVDTTVGADATNYQTINFYRTGSSTALGTAWTSAAGLTLHVPDAISGIDDTLPAGDTLYMTITKTESGKALSGLKVAITYEVAIPEAQQGVATDNVLRIINGGAGSDGAIESDHLQRDHLEIRRSGKTVLRIDVDGIMHPGDTYIPPDQYYAVVVGADTIVDADGGAKKTVILKPNGTIKIEKVYYGVNTDCDADDDTNYTQVLIKDNSGNILTDAFVNGPQTEADLTAGYLYDMGALNETYAEITSSETLQAEYVCNGTAPDVPGLVLVVIYRKID